MIDHFVALFVQSLVNLLVVGDGKILEKFRRDNRRRGCAAAIFDQVVRGVLHFLLDESELLFHENFHELADPVGVVHPSHDHIFRAEKFARILPNAALMVGQSPSQNPAIAKPLLGLFDRLDIQLGDGHIFFDQINILRPFHEMLFNISGFGNLFGRIAQQAIGSCDGMLDNFVGRLLQNFRLDLPVGPSQDGPVQRPTHYGGIHVELLKGFDVAYSAQMFFEVVRLKLMNRARQPVGLAHIQSGQHSFSRSHLKSFYQLLKNSYQ